ncbi:MAG: hypothetical protein BGO92_01150 [Magnetospirillum sp. 64-120]|nr:MAG: hypothetical protein BGO92_01150 [Magnetospirillum sp. 64-120]
MRVLHVHCEFVPQNSGVARHMAGLCRALVRRGDVIPTILAPGPHGPGPHEYPVVEGGWGQLAARIRAADLVHAHGSRTMISAAALRLARRLGKPTVFTPHCYYQDGGRLHRLAKRLWDRGVERGTIAAADAVVLLHDQWRAALAEMGLAPRRVAVIPNCIDAEALRARLERVPARRLSGDPALLSIGRLAPVKRLGDVVAALARPELAQAHLHIVGRGSEAERLRTQADQLGVGGRVHLLGGLDDDEAAALMRGADAMVLASGREGLPTVMLESLAAGIPIAVSDIEGTRVVAEGVGWPHLFPVGDDAAMAVCLRNCLAQPVPPAVVQSVLRQFSWQGRADDMAALYHDLVGR